MARAARCRLSEVLEALFTTRAGPDSCHHAPVGGDPHKPECAQLMGAVGSRSDGATISEPGGIHGELCTHDGRIFNASSGRAVSPATTLPALPRAFLAKRRGCPGDPEHPLAGRPSAMIGAKRLVAPAGVEPAARGLGNRCSIRLSYGANGPGLCAIASSYASGLGWFLSTSEPALLQHLLQLVGQRLRLAGSW